MAVASIQGSRPITVQTALGKDALLLVSLKGREAISELFHFDLELLTEFVGLGLRFVSAGTDVGFMTEAASAHATRLRAIPVQEREA